MAWIWIFGALLVVVLINVYFSWQDHHRLCPICGYRFLKFRTLNYIDKAMTDEKWNCPVCNYEDIHHDYPIES